ncbi:MAG: Mur ligase family protein [Alphaproteobacteria bacterium]|nr:Mur ligase family protein [Alphaproteobacteria bacterium]
MTVKSSFFFCAIGGSGMMPLALALKARGAAVSGSDRARDQGRTPDRFAFLEKQGITLFPQDGSGVRAGEAMVVVSTAVEPTVPDYQAALELGRPILHRAALLAQLANSACVSIAVAGTSGKSTTTGMTGWVLQRTGRVPTIINGAVMKNFVAPETPFASSVVGDPDLMVVEADESDGSIEHYTPTIAVLNNIAVDHKTMEELRALFAAFLERAGHAVVNLDNAESAALAQGVPTDKLTTFSLEDESATLYASDIALVQEGAGFTVTHTPSGESADVRLRVTGRHNAANALAALGAVLAVGVSFQEACAALGSFEGMVRRMDVVGQAVGVTVIDDFAHNPDKITATLAALHQFGGRLLILFQPHGYGPLRLMKDAFVEAFATQLDKDDLLFLPEPLYLGGTVNREVTSRDLAEALMARGVSVTAHDKRETCADSMVAQARAGDRLIIMGARDDTLTTLAGQILARVGEKEAS